jgi:hypothetical protein
MNDIKQNVSFKQARIRSEPEPKNTISTPGKYHVSRSGKYHIEIRQILGAERIRIQNWHRLMCDVLVMNVRTTDEQQKPPTPAENKCIACIITAPGHPSFLS